MLREGNLVLFMILNCTFIGITSPTYYVFNTIEIPETFMNSILILFGHGLHTKWKAKPVKVTEGHVEGCNK